MGVGEGQPYPPQMSPEIRTRIIRLPAGPIPAHRAKAEFLAFLPSLSRTCSFFWFLSLQMASPLSLAPVRNLEAVLTPLSSTARSDKRDCGRLRQMPWTLAHPFLPLRLRLHRPASRLPCVSSEIRSVHGILCSKASDGPPVQKTIR